MNTAPFTIEVGEYNNAQGTVSGITVNGVATNIFNAGALGEGTYLVTATFDAGAATTSLIINGVQESGSNADGHSSADNINI